MENFKNPPARVKVKPHDGSRPLGIFDGSSSSFKQLKFEYADDELAPQTFLVPARVVVKTIEILREKRDDLEKKRDRNEKQLEVLESNAAILEGFIAMTNNQELKIKLDKLNNQIHQLKRENSELQK